MNNLELMIIDIDGTLCPNLGRKPREFKPSKELFDAVQKASRKTRICFCTGRDKNTVISIITNLKLKKTFHVIEGGARIIDSRGSVISNKLLDPKAVENIFRLIKKLDKPFSIINENKQINNDCPLSYRGISAILIYNLSKIDLVSFKTNAEKIKRTSFVINKGGKYNTAYITDINATKAKGIELIMSLLSISKEQILGIGDGSNDLSLLEMSGVKVAMGNAVNELKEIADYIAPKVTKDGLIKVIEKYIL